MTKFYLEGNFAPVRDDWVRGEDAYLRGAISR